MSKILIVEDEKALVKVLRYNLEKEGYEVVAANDGPSGLEAFRRDRPDFIILDIMLPKLDGFEFCKAVRQVSRTPVLMLTARKDELDRVLGLELGADDYVTKPFSIREVLARIKTILRRTAAGREGAASVRIGQLDVDFARYEVRVAGRPAALTPKEFSFLKCLVEADGRALTRDELLFKVWGHERGLELDTNTVEQHIARLRAKLGPEAGRLLTVKNVGYRLRRD
ncbi:MAG: response regulator transcription factor [Elusimicrobia bacterium]|nr:response regulator transcription factor [Elusimicrobiota bacterium]